MTGGGTSSGWTAALAALGSAASAVSAASAASAASGDDGAAVKACCAAAYGGDLVGLFLGESYHPGGIELTRRLADALELRPGERVLDVAAGIGTTALLLAGERHVDAVGIDLGESQVAQARARARASLAGGGGAAARCVGGGVRFELGDAERLPFDDGTFDAAVCECAFCTFPDKETAAAELARVLRPGGRVGITDVWLDRDHLDEELSGLAGRVACLADARPIDELRAIIEGAGLHVELIECHDDALAATIERVETRLRALRLVDLTALRTFNLRRGIELTRQAAQIVARGGAGYALLVATKP